MDSKRLQANMLLFLTAAIWGFAFVAQRVGSKYVGVFTFNGIRFAIGSLSLLPLIIYLGKRKKSDVSNKSNIEVVTKKIIVSGILLGTILFAGSTFQQIGLIYTTASKSSFITGFYMIFVPVIGMALGHKAGKKLWIGVGLAVIGLYLLSINENFSIGYGDLLELICSIFFALHILAIDYFCNKVDSLKLSCIQFATCSSLSLISAIVFDKITISAILNALIPILYGGILSSGVAYTLQVVAQKHAKPSHAAIILSMESVFGAIGGALILGEIMSAKGYIGCILIFVGILVPQLRFSKKQLLKVNAKDETTLC